MNNVNVEIAGVAGVGKTTIAHKVAQVLKEYGVNVTIFDDQYDDCAVSSEKVENNLTSIGTNTNVVIRCRQLKRCSV